MRSITSLAVLVVALAASTASAIPAFARKTGLACSACHEVWPRLNDFGQQFRDNGFRLRRGRDAPVEQDPAYWPLTMRTTVGYQWLRQTLVPTDTGTVTAQTGSFGFTGLDVISGGTLGEKLSYLVTYTPGLDSAGFGTSPSSGNLESAWVALDEPLGSTWVNLRVGKHALDLPEDEHRALSLTQGYNSLHYHPQGTTTTFETGANASGVEVWGHSELSRARYSISLVNENDAPLSNNGISSPVAWAHAQGSQVFDSRVLAEVKVGAFGALGWHPTATETLTPLGGVAAPVAGTATQLKRFTRAGGEAHLYFLSSILPLTLTGVVLYGQDDAALVTGATRAASFLGGWTEVTYTPTIHFSAQARWERIRPLDAGSDAAFLEAGSITALTALVRHTFELTSRTEVALHAEVSHSTNEDGTGQLPATTVGLVGFDIAF